MLRVLTLFVTIAVINAKPTGIGSVGVAAIAPSITTAVHSIPVATSSQSRHDIIHPGVVTVQTAHAVPVVSHAVSVPLQVSSAATSQIDVRTPTVAAVATHPVIASAPAITTSYGAGIGLGGGVGLGVGHGLGAVGLGTSAAGYGVSGHGGLIG